MLDRSVAPPYAEVKYDPFQKVEKKILSSGIPVFELNTGEQPVIRFELKLQCGSWYENQKAAAWFTTKMLFEGTKTKSANDISQAFENLGAFLDLEPGFDDVSISIYGMSRNFTQVLDLLVEILNEASFPATELDALKVIRENEIKSNDAKSSMLASKKIRQALFGLDHPYGKALKSEDIQAISLEVVSDCYSKDFFRNPEIFISGHFDESIFKWLDKNFNIPESNSSPDQNDNNLASTSDIYVEKENSLQSSIKLAWHCPVIGSDSYYNFLIATTLFGGYFGSRLMKNIREDKGYTYGISAYPIDLKNASFSIISSDVKAENTLATIEEIWHEIKKLTEEPTDQEEIEMVVNYMAGKFQSSLSTPFKLMSKFTKIHKAGLDYDHYEKLFQALNDFDQTKLVESIHNNFSPSKAHQVIVGKKS